MTPQQAYEKRYANIDGGQHTWDAAPPHVKEMWLAAWTIAWAMGEEAGREAVAREYVDKMISVYPQGIEGRVAAEREACAVLVEQLLSENPDLSEVFIAAEIRARGQE